MSGALLQALAIALACVACGIRWQPGATRRRFLVANDGRQRGHRSAVVETTGRAGETSTSAPVTAPPTTAAPPTTTGAKGPSAQELAALAARSVVAPADLGVGCTVTLPGGVIVAPKEASCLDRAAPALARVAGVGGEIGSSISHDSSPRT